MTGILRWIDAIPEAGTAAPSKQRYVAVKASRSRCRAP
jgi:hypothetical protein